MSRVTIQQVFTARELLHKLEEVRELCIAKVSEKASLLSVLAPCMHCNSR